MSHGYFSKCKDVLIDFIVYSCNDQFAISKDLSRAGVELGVKDVLLYFAVLLRHLNIKFVGKRTSKEG